MQHKMGYSFACLILLISIVTDVAASFQPSNTINPSTLEEETVQLLTGKASQLPEVYQLGEEALGLNPMDVEVMSELGGAVSTVAVQGNYAYLGLGIRLVVLDIEDPAHPFVVGQSGFLPGVVKQIGLAGGYAYLALQTGDMSIIDVTNPSNPVEIGRYDSVGNIQHIIIRDEYLYLIGGGLRILEISTPTYPREVGRYDDPYYPQSVELVGDYIYLGVNNSLAVIDISNPSSPERVTSIDLYALDLVVQGNYVYVLSIMGLVILDVSQPTHPKTIASSDISGYHEAVNGNFLYISGNGQENLTIVDVSTPTEPEEVEAFKTEFATEIVVSAGYLYLVKRSGLLLLDVSVPDKPVQAGQYSGLGRFSLLALEGSYAYLEGNGGLNISDISDIKQPFIAGFYSLPQPITSIKIVGSYAYLTLSTGMQILDVSTPADPVPLGFYPTAYPALDVDVKGDFAYIATGWGNVRYAETAGVLYVVDVSNPQDLRQVMELSFGIHVTDIVIDGDYAYIGTLFELRRVQLFEGGVVAESGSVSVGDSIQDIDVENGYVYLTKAGTYFPEYDEDGLHIFQADSLNRIAFIGDMGSPPSVDVDGSYAYVSSSNGLYLLDVTDPQVPVKVGFFNGMGFVTNTKVQGQGPFAFVTGGSGGLIILRFFERHSYFPLILHNGSRSQPSIP